MPAIPAAVDASQIQTKNGQANDYNFPNKNAFQRRQEQYPLTADSTNCDGRNIFTCGSDAFCYTDLNYIGCCSTDTPDTCLGRTTCLPYTDNPTTSCESYFGGCVTCTDPALPSCVFVTNSRSDTYSGYYFRYCDISSTDITTSFPFAEVKTSTDRSTTSTTDSMPPSSATVNGPGASRTASDLKSTSTTSAMSQHSSAGSSNGLSKGEIAGIVVGVIGGLALAAIISLCLLRKKLKRNSTAKDPPTGNLTEKSYADQSRAQHNLSSSPGPAVSGNRDMTGHTNNDVGITSATGDMPVSPQGKWEDSPYSRQSGFSPSPVTTNGSVFTNTNHIQNPPNAPGIRQVSPAPPELPSQSASQRPTSEMPASTPDLPERSPARTAQDATQSAQAIPQFIPYRPAGSHPASGDLARGPTSATGFTGGGTALRGSGWLSPEDAMAGGYRESVFTHASAVPEALVPGGGGRGQRVQQ